MMIIKCIFLIALLQYSFGETLENRIRRSPRKTKAPVTPGLTTIPKPIVSCGENKECINFQHCDNGKLVTDGDNLIDLRDDINDVCPHYLDVCCDAANITVDGFDTSHKNKIATKCGVLNPTGVGMKIKEIIDREAQFGKVY